MWIAQVVLHLCRLELMICHTCMCHPTVARSVKSSSWLVYWVVARVHVTTPCKRIRFSRKTPGFYFEQTCHDRVWSSVRSTKTGRSVRKRKVLVNSLVSRRQLGPVAHADLLYSCSYLYDQFSTLASNSAAC